jgi:PAS domain S-box-containing protein
MTAKSTDLRGSKATNKAEAKNSDFPIVGIGASAGGLEALKDKTYFIKKIIDTSAISTLIVDKNGLAINANNACLDLFGVTREEGIGKYNILKDNVLKGLGVLSEIKKVFKEGKTVVSINEYFPGDVTHIAARNPKRKTVKSIYTPILDPRGEISNVIIQSIDLTEIKKNELKLTKAKEKAEKSRVKLKELNKYYLRNNKLLEASQSIAKLGGWELDLNTNKLYWTKETYKIHDTSPEEFDPTVDAGVSYFLPESKKIITNALELAITKGEGYDLYLETYTTKGRKINVRTTAEVICDNGKPIKLIGIFQDITKQKEVEQELLTAKENAELSKVYLDTIINNIGNPVFVKDNESRLLLVNEAFCKLFSLPKDQIIGKTLAEDVKPEERERFLKIDKQVLSDGIENISEEFITVRDNETLTIETRKTRFLDTAGNKYLVGVTRDITKNKKIEEELIRAKIKAEESDRLKSAFLANMSHEIRTPMNGILGFSSLLKSPQLTDNQQKKYIEVIEKSGNRMLNIINDIVDISKIEAGLMKVDIKESNINEQMEYIYTFFKSEVEAKGMELFLKNTLPNEEVTIHTDREKLFAILTNLVKNAIKYSDEGSIEFGYGLKTADEAVHKNQNSVLEFFVKDTGIGIAKDRQKAIFERFIQADITDKMARQGAGLGLSITKAYVEALGGKIWVESKKGKGSIFYFTIPYNTVEIENIVAEIDVSINEMIVIDPYVFNNLKVLIAEDDEVSEILLTITIEEFSKEILIARTGSEAVEICKNNPDIDLVLMDIQMPELNGYEATRQIRQFNKEVIIIAQTAFGLAGDKEKSLNAGCNDYLRKPIKKTHLDLLIQKYFKK